MTNAALLDVCVAKERLRIPLGTRLSDRLHTYKLQTRPFTVVVINIRAVRDNNQDINGASSLDH
jgi:hypothetical protein